ncbi:MAG: phytoene desaturase family protein [Thermodesulfobacteriota bacterium]
MKDKTYDVAIIGAGPNGLICGAYLARAGLKVILLEARHETGGGLDTLEFAGFKYNPHAIYHMMAELMPVYRDFNLRQRGVRFIYPEVQAAYISTKHAPLVLYRDPKKTAEYIGAAFSARDGEAYGRMYRDFREYSEKILIPLTYVPAIPPVEQVQVLNNARDDVGRRFNEIAELPPIEILNQYDFSDPVKAAVLNLFTMWGLSPHEALGYIFPLYVYRMTQAALCSGGSHRLSSAIHKSIVAAGGAISDDSMVVKILSHAGKIKGVLLDDGTEIHATAVASTVDPHQTFLRFFEPDELPEELRNAAGKWEWEKITLFGAHLALRRAPQYIGTESCADANRAMITFLGIDDTNVLLDHHAALESGQVPRNNFFGHTTCASIFDPIQAPEGYHTGRWECLVPYENDWEKEKWTYAESCVKQWKQYAPNLDPIHTLVYPPTYIEKKIINMVRGSIKQGAYVPLQMGYFRPNDACSRCHTPVEGLYVCGASVYPGGMIIGGPGYIGANTIAADFGVAKWWDEIDLVKQARANGIITD